MRKIYSIGPQRARSASQAAILATSAAPKKVVFATCCSSHQRSLASWKGSNAGHTFVGVAGRSTLLKDINVNPVDGSYGPGPAKERYNLGYIGAAAAGDLLAFY